MEFLAELPYFDWELALTLDWCELFLLAPDGQLDWLKAGRLEAQCFYVELLDW